jgi:hypothetical protein
MSTSRREQYEIENPLLSSTQIKHECSRCRPIRILVWKRQRTQNSPAIHRRVCSTIAPLALLFTAPRGHMGNWRLAVYGLLLLP